MNSGLGTGFIHLIMVKPLSGAGITKTKLAAYACNYSWIMGNFL